MHRAALVATRLVVLVLGLGLGTAACGDKAAPALVDDETIRWQLSASSVSFKPHAPGEDVDFEVSCSISGDSIEFTITAPRVPEEGRPQSVLSVRQGSPGTNTCIVNVTEAPKDGDGEYRLQDSCKGTDAMGGCVLTGAFDSDGWDFAGQLICTNLKDEPTDSPISLVNSVASNDPVTIKLDNCD